MFNFPAPKALNALFEGIKRAAGALRPASIQPQPQFFIPKLPPLKKFSNLHKNWRSHGFRQSEPGEVGDGMARFR